MIIVAVIQDEDTKSQHEEYYQAPDDITDAKIWNCLRKLVSKFNNSLRPGESARRIVEVYEETNSEVDDSNIYPLVNHSWVKSNLVTVMDGIGSYDAYRCEVCGVTGKRRSLFGSVKLDKRFSTKKYLSCKVQ